MLRLAIAPTRSFWATAMILLAASLGLVNREYDMAVVVVVDLRQLLTGKR